MRLLSGLLSSLGLNFSHPRKSGYRSKRKRALQKAVVETLDPRILMSISAATGISESYDFSADDNVLYASSSINVTFTWTNHEPASLTTAISFEVQEWDNATNTPALGGSANFFSAAYFVGGTANSETIALDMNSSFNIQIRTYTIDGSVVSATYTATTPNWTSISVANSETNSSDASMLTWNTGTSGAYSNLDVLYRQAVNPYPNRWNQTFGNLVDATSPYSTLIFPDYYGNSSPASAPSTVEAVTDQAAFYGGDAYQEGIGGTDGFTFSTNASHSLSTPTVTGTYSAGTVTLAISGGSSDWTYYVLGEAYGGYPGGGTVGDEVIDDSIAGSQMFYEGSASGSDPVISFTDTGINGLAVYNPFSRLGYYEIYAVDMSDEVGTYTYNYVTTPIYASSPLTSYIDLSPAITPGFAYASPIINGSDTISWLDSSDNETGFQVWRREGSGTVETGTGCGWTLVGTVGAGVTELTDTGKNADGSSIGPLQQGETYQYEIRAIRANSALDSGFELAIDQSFGGCLVCLQNQLLHPPIGSVPAADSSGGATNYGSTAVPLQGLSSGIGSNFGEQVVITPDGTGEFGRGTSSGTVPYFQKFGAADCSDDSGTIVVSVGGYHLYWDYDEFGDIYGINGNPYDLTMTDLGGGVDQYSLIDSAGDSLLFNCSAGSGAVVGQFAQWSDPAGDTETASYNGYGQLASLNEDLAAGHYETLTYTYGSDASDAPVEKVALSYDGGNPVEAQTFSYDGDGNLSTMTDTLYNGTNPTSNTVSYMRYTEDGDISRLEYLVTGSNYDRLIADNGTNYQTASLTNYADDYYQYDDEGRLISVTSQGNGCSLCTGGLGTTTFNYDHSNFGFSLVSSSTISNNTWVYKRVEYAPGFDSTNTSNAQNAETIIYSNSQGQTLLQVTIQTATGAETLTAFQYDSNGNLITTASPSALTGYSEADPDLVNWTGTDGGTQYVSTTSGLIQWTDYYSSTASDGSVGGMTGFIEDTAVSQGTAGTRYYQSFTDYYIHTASGVTSTITVAETADSVTFQQNVTASSTSPLSAGELLGAGGQITTSSYSFFSGTNQIQSMTTSAPTVLSTQNGPGTPDVTETVYDIFGEPVWTMDANGYIGYTSYDPTTGAVVETITDVNTSDSGDFSNLPTGWRTPAGGGLNLVTTYGNDSQGRTTSQTDSNGIVTITIYDDADHAVFTLPDVVVQGTGSLSTNCLITTNGPMTMERDDIPYQYTSVSWSGTSSTTTTLTGAYSESLTFSGTLTISAGVVQMPDFIASTGGTSSTDANVLNLQGNQTSGYQFTIQSLSRSLDNAAEQNVESDSYFNLGTDGNYTYLHTATMSAYTGSVNTNYYATQYFYDDAGNQARTIDPNGTITDTLYDYQGREVATYVGTNDTPNQNFNGYGTDNWEDFLYYVANHDLSVPSASCGTNMTLVTVNQYDFGGVGDGNLTENISYPGGSQAPRATEYLYDWQDRQISSKSGVETALPSGFSDSDIGSPSMSGSGTFDGATFIVSGGGAGLTTTSDQFNFLSESLSGDTTLKVRVDSVTSVNNNGSQAGLMLRANSSVGAMFAAVGVTPQGGVEFQWRTSTNATAMGTTTLSVAAPVWLELIRSGNSFTAKYSTDDSTWTQIGSTETIVLGSSELAGLAVSADDNSGLSTARFDNFSVGGTAITASETDGVHRPLTVNTLDNAGDVIATAQYDGDGTFMVDANGDGIPDGLDSSTLRAYSTSDYDAQGRVYQTTTYSVDPSTGATNGSLTLVSYTWYDHDGNTIATWSSGGPMTKNTYDGAGRVTATYTTDGGAVNNSTAPGNILMSWADAGTVSNDVVLSQTEYQYDADGNVILTTDRERFDSDPSTATGALTNANDTSSGLQARVSYSFTYYDGAGRPIEMVDVGTNGAVSNDTSSGGVNLNIASGIASRPATMPNRTVNTDTLITTYTYNAAGEQATLTDPKGITSETLYDLLGQTTYTIAAWDGTYNASTGTLPTSSSINQTTHYTYDGDGNMISETAVMPSGQDSQTTLYIYNLSASGVTTAGIVSNDLLWKVEYPDPTTGSASSSQVVVYTYDNLGDVLTTTDRNGNTHTYGYDVLGRQVSDSASGKPTGSYSVDVGLQDPTFADASGSYGDFTFNPSGDAWTYSGNAGVYDPYSGNQMAFLQDGGSISQAMTLPAGTYIVMIQAADYAGDTEAVDVSVDGTDLGTLTPVPQSGSLTIDAPETGFLSGTITLGAGMHTLTLSGTGDGGSVLLSDVAFAQPTTAMDDDDPNFNSGEFWTFSGNSGDYNGAYITEDDDGNGGTVTAGVYFQPGTYVIGLSAYQQGENPGTAEGDQIVSIDINGTPVGDAATPGITAALISSDVFTITEAGTYTLSFTDAFPGELPGASLGFMSGLTLDQVATGTLTLGTIIASQEIVTTYNSQGLVESITSYDAAEGGNPINQILYEYNGFGQQTAEYQQHAGTVDTGSTLATTYTYNTASTSIFGSRLVSETYPGGDAIDYNYTVSGTASLDSVISRLDAMSTNGITLESYTYLGPSTVVVEEQPQDGVELTYIDGGTGDGGDKYTGLDRFGRVVNQNWVNATDSAVSVDEVIYHYDADGNVTEEDYPLAIVIPDAHSDFDETFTYDNLNRLTAVTHYNGSANDQSFALNAVGAITGITTGGIVQNRTTNSENQITAIGSADISYDNNGNVTTDDQGQTLIWDAWNRLVGVQNSSGQLIATYTYDGLGRIASETSIDPTTLVTTTTDLYYAGNQEIEERTGVTDANGNNLSSNGSTTLTNVFSPMDGNITLRDEGGTRLYFTHDVTGDVTAVLNTSGGVLQRQNYTAEGDVSFLEANFSLKDADDYGLAYLWQNGERDRITQMYKFGYRWYTPSLQWISFDPDGYVDGANGYISRIGNPVSYTDPDGLSVQGIFNALLALYKGRYAHTEITNAVEKDNPDVYPNLSISSIAEDNGGDISKVKGLKPSFSELNPVNWPWYVNAPIPASEKEILALIDWGKLQAAKYSERLRPDLVVKEPSGVLDVYEIKSTAEGAAAAATDAEGYVNMLKLTGLNARLGPTTLAGGTNEAGSATPFGILRWRSPQDGVITYNYCDPSNDKEEAEVAGQAKALAAIQAKLMAAAEAAAQAEAMQGMPMDGPQIGPIPGSEPGGLPGQGGGALPGEDNAQQLREELQKLDEGLKNATQQAEEGREAA